jgi:hypothetical protein
MLHGTLYIYIFAYYPCSVQNTVLKDRKGSRNSKDREYNDLKKNDKRTKNYQQNSTKETTDWAIRTPPKCCELRCTERVTTSFTITEIHLKVLHATCIYYGFQFHITWQGITLLNREREQCSSHSGCIREAKWLIIITCESVRQWINDIGSNPTEDVLRKV